MLVYGLVLALAALAQVHFFIVHSVLGSVTSRPFRKLGQQTNQRMEMKATFSWKIL